VLETRGIEALGPSTQLLDLPPFCGPHPLSDIDKNSGQIRLFVARRADFRKSSDGKG